MSTSRPGRPPRPRPAALRGGRTGERTGRRASEEAARATGDVPAAAEVGEPVVEESVVDEVGSPRESAQPAGTVSPRGGVPSMPVPSVRRYSVVSTGVVERLAERDAMRRHRRRRRLLTLTVVVVVLAVLGWVVFFSPAFATDADEVDVTGAGNLVDVQRVESIADGAAGIPLPRLDTVSLREKLLAVRGVKDVAIVREWPRGLAVRITPRDPVAAVPDAGRYALVDEDATRIATVDVPPSGVPVVDVPLTTSAEPALQAVLTVVSALPDSLGAQVTAASAKTQDTVTLTLRGGVTVVWGSAEDTPLKVRVLTALRKASQSKHATSFDLSAPNLPVTRG